jgi:hypothetical protein
VDDSDGPLLPVTLLERCRAPTGGYSPEELDRRIGSLLHTLGAFETTERTSRPVIEELLVRMGALVTRWKLDPAAPYAGMPRERLGELVVPGDVTAAEHLDDLGKLAEILERLQRGRAQSVKALNELTRLRAYLKEAERGEQGRLEDRSDAELLAMIRRVTGEASGSADP